MTLPVRHIGLALILASAPLLFGGSPATTNTGGPPVARRNFTPAEIQSTLRSMGIFPNAKPSAVSCYVSDSTGTTVTTISPASYPGGPFYWLHYTSGGVVSTTVAFILKPMFTGSAQSGQVQVFAPNSDTNIETPFGIPFWGGDSTSGPWMLEVESNTGEKGTCNFTVSQ